MSTVQDFDTTFNEVVQAKRLSQSKMTKLTELALKLMDQDTQLVSTMYRSHKMLPASCKISSLYVFDALARAARQQVIKHNLSERHATGNCATFLSKVAGVLEGLFQDIVAAGLPEAKEKTRKIYDIWVKGNTFPPDILSRLLDVVSGKDKVTEVNASVTADPRIVSQINSTVPPQSPVAPTATDTQATLLALLTQAASHQVAQTTTNTTVTPTAPLDPAQLAILQYLQAASVNNTAASQISPISAEPSDSRITQKVTDRQISDSPAPQVEPNRTRQDNRREYRSPSQNGRSYERDYDKKSHSYKENRGGFRRHGRWNRWDEREPLPQRDQPEAGWSPRSGGRSRSHSPDGRTHRRPPPVPPSSSQRQSSPSRSQYHGDSSTSHPPSSSSGKDEFGRDLRSPSPFKPPNPGLTSNQHNSTSPNTPTVSHFSKTEFPSTSTSNDRMSRSSIAANTFPKEPDAFETSHESSNKTGHEVEMGNFDISTFDPTSPASWEAMGKMWEITNGYQPSTEELMQFVMMGTMSQQLQPKNWQQGDALMGYGNDQRRRGGSGEHGNSRSNHHGCVDDGMDSSTDAIVLGGGEMEMDESAESEGSQRQEPVDSGTRSGGKMQRVGDRWVFVRNDTGAQ